MFAVSFVCNRLRVNFLNVIHLSTQSKVFSIETTKLNEEESSKVLNIINTAKNEELLKYNITKGRAKKLAEWKTKNGPFDTVDQILLIDGFGVKVVENFFESILQEKYDIIQDKKNKKRGNAFTIPSFPDELSEKYKSCVSLNINVSNVTWSKIDIKEKDLPCELTHWGYYDLTNKRLHISDLVQRCRYIEKIIPEADCYILENPQLAQGGAPGSADQTNINVQRSQIISMLNLALASRTNFTLEEKRVFYLKRYLSYRLFNTLVGKERVSTEQIILDLMRTHYNFEDNIDNTEKSAAESYSDKINIPLDLRKVFNNAERYQRDFLGQSLLLGLTFIRLCLLKSPKSLAALEK